MGVARSVLRSYGLLLVIIASKVKQRSVELALISYN